MCRAVPAPTCSPQSSGFCSSVLVHRGVVSTLQLRISRVQDAYDASIRRSCAVLVGQITEQLKDRLKFLSRNRMRVGADSLFGGQEGQDVSGVWVQLSFVRSASRTRHNMHLFSPLTARLWIHIDPLWIQSVLFMLCCWLFLISLFLSDLLGTKLELILVVPSCHPSKNTAIKAPC